MLRDTSFASKTLATAIALVCAQWGQQALAQGDLRLEEIIVTSQKIQENIQDVPISVSAVSSEKLADAGIENLEDLTAYLPNIHFTESGFSTQVRVRGVGSDNSQGFEQSVGMYVDGIYYGRAQLFRTPMMDMQRAELLRGPQSTLFGKNSVAGALNLTTARPTEEFEGRISYSHEFEHAQDEVNLMLSGPLTDTLRGRIALRGYTEDGYYENTFKNTDEPETEETAGRVTLDWTPTDTLQFLLKAERNEFETEGRAIEITRDVGLPNEAGVIGFGYSRILQLLQEPGFDDELNYSRQTNLPEFSDNSIDNITLTSNIDIGDYTLTLVTGHLAFDYNELCDCDFVAANILDLELFEDYEQFSQEIRIQSPLGERVEWTAGVFYQDYDQTFEDRLTVGEGNLLPRIPVPPPRPPLDVIASSGAARDFNQSSEAWAAFGRVRIGVTDSLSLILGARYTDEQKDATKTIFLYDAETRDPLTGDRAAAAGISYLGNFLLESEQSPGGHDVAGSRSETPLDPLVIVEYDFNADVMGYASYTTGSKAGGFDPRSNNRASFEFEDEESEAIEVGVKSTLADGRLELNAALYRMDYDELQISQFDGAVGFNVGNAKETRVQGLELDGRLLIVEGLTMNYGLSYLDFEYLDFANGNCAVGETPTGVTDGPVPVPLCDYTGRRGVYTPEYTLNLSFDYFTPITDTISFAGFLDMQWVDEHNVHVNLDPAGDIDAYTMINARIGLESENWSVGLLGKNLADEEVISYSANAPLSDSNFRTNTFYSFVRRPMTIALEGVFRF